MTEAKMGFTGNQAMILSGVNTAGLITLFSYTLRNLNELKKENQALKEELNSFKGNFMDNNKRASMALRRLDNKIEDALRRETEKKTPKIKKEKVVIQTPNVIEEEEEEEYNDLTFGNSVNDDIEKALESLSRRKSTS